ncbi:MAG: hypothetical protein ACREUU_08255 [Gammaproteobacteria bacterium]
MKRDRSWLFFPLVAEGALSWILLWAIIDDWGIPALLIIGVGLVVFWVAAVWAFRLQNYVILHEGRVDVKQVPWWGDELRIFRIPYDSIIDVRSNDERVSIVFGEATSPSVKTVSFRPIDPRHVASQIESRVENAKSAKEEAGRQSDPP